MVFATLLAYFLLVAFAVVMFVFPDYRARVTELCKRILHRVWGKIHTIFKGTFASIRTVVMGCRNLFISLKKIVQTYPLLTGVAFLTIATPPVLALIIGGPTIFIFEDISDSKITDKQIAILLEGEHLVPPPALPPEFFTTREVEMVRPDIVHASRNWKQLDEEFTQKLLVVFKLMKERHDYEMVLLEGYRSPERQAKLQAQGSHVTQAGAFKSYHQYGLAADSAFLRNGKIVITERDPWAMRGYELYGEIAEQVGLVWGGRWKMKDYGHVELRRKGVLGRPYEPNSNVE